MNEVDRARWALHSIDAGCPRAEWIELAMAAKAAGLSFDDFHAWSEPAHNYRNEADCRAVWRSIDEAGGIGAGTLFAKAREAGWREPMNGHSKPHQSPPEPRKPEPRTERAPFDIAGVWRDSEPATATHPYIGRKLGLPAGLRVYRGGLTLNGQALDGALLVPARDADGNLQSWQAIPPDGDKRNAPGATIKGASFTVGGAPREGEPLYLCEGIGQAWSAHQATGSPAVVCFGAGNVETIARQMHERHPAARIVIVADAGKERDAERIATAVGGAWVAMPEGSPGNFDLNDFHLQARSLPAVAELLAQARGPQPEAIRFRFLTVGELLRQPAQAWRVLRVIPARGLVVLWGASGSGKTFAALDMAGAIVRGLPWAGRRTKRGAVAYIAAEGHMRDRIDAYLRHNGLTAGDLAGLRVLDSAVDLLDPSADIQPLLIALHEVAAETDGIAVVIVDTLNRVMPGGDENASEDMGLVIAAAKLIEREFGCAVVFIHHSGKDESKGSRGHSSLKAATDAEVSVKRDGDVRTVTAEKVRDGADGEMLMTFRLHPVDLGAMREVDPGADADERRTSCVVEPIEALAAARTAPEAVRLSDTDHIALRALRELCADTEDRTEATSLHPAGLGRVAIDDWRERFRRVRGVATTDPKALDASRKAFQRAVDKLTKQRLVGVYEARAWLW